MALTDDERLTLLDGAGHRLCKGYADLGCTAYIIRDYGDGHVAIVGPGLPPETVARLLDKVKAAYLEKVDPAGFGRVN